jgi:hypothetical protein
MGRIQVQKVVHHHHPSSMTAWRHYITAEVSIMTLIKNEMTTMWIQNVTTSLHQLDLFL